MKLAIYIKPLSLMNYDMKLAIYINTTGGTKCSLAVTFSSNIYRKICDLLRFFKTYKSISQKIEESIFHVSSKTK